MSDPPLDTIAEAFSRTAARYDAFAVDHPHLTRMRTKVYEHVCRVVPTGAHILELNAGTGTDACQLAERGYRVHATDISPGMLTLAQRKIETFQLGDRVVAQQCSFTALDGISTGPFDAVFSNLGGLNCVDRLDGVIDQLPRLLRPGGVVCWVLMPRICLWELALIATGQPRLATRRLNRSGTCAHLEGKHFPVYYFPPRRVVAAFGSRYRMLALEGLSVITPTAESKTIAKRHRRLYAALCWLDDRVTQRAPWSGWGDFYILSMRYQPDASPAGSAACWSPS